MIKKILTLYRKTLYYTGLTKVLKKINKNKVKVLMYHSIQGPKFLPKNLIVLKKNFEKHIRYLKKNYNIITWTDFVLKKYKQNSILITFDDGFMDNYTYAFPILKRYNVPAIIFRIGETSKRINWLHKLYYLAYKDKTKTINRFNELTNNNFNKMHECVDFVKYNVKDKNKLMKNFEEVEIKRLYLSNNEINKMQPFFTFGYHTKTHSILSNLDEKELINEIESARNEECFAYPFGEESSYNDHSIQILKKYYKAAFSTTEDFFSGDLFRIERLSITNLGIDEFVATIEGSNILFTKIYKKLRFQKNK